MPRFGDATPTSLRIVVSSAGGKVLFLPEADRPEIGQYMLEGDPICVVRSRNGSDSVVRSTFKGWLAGYLVMEREPITPGAPVLWLTAVPA